VSFSEPWSLVCHPLTSWMRGISMSTFSPPSCPKPPNPFQLDHPLHGDRAVFAHRVEPHQGRHGPAAIRGSVADLQLPFYPVAYGVAVSCFVQCLVLVADMVKIYRGEYE